jgi:hypothetical protein
MTPTTIARHSRIGLITIALAAAPGLQGSTARADHPGNSPSADTDANLLQKRFDLMGKGVDGITDDQKAKLAVIRKSADDAIKDDMTKINDPKFKESLASQYRDVLTADQQKTFDLNMVEAAKLETKAKTESNLYYVGAAFKYFPTVDEKGAADLGALSDQQITPEDFLVADSKTKVPADWNDMTPAARKDWVNKNTDFVYLGGGLKRADIKPETVMAYVKPEVYPDGNEFLMGDGSVRAKSAEDSKKIIAELKDGKNPPPSMKAN